MVALFSLRGTYDFVKPSDPRRPEREREKERERERERER